ncbi:MAG TPA: Ig-like domain-containing protein [Planctomycetota bacterium]
MLRPLPYAVLLVLLAGAPALAAQGPHNAPPSRFDFVLQRVETGRVVEVRDLDHELVAAGIFVRDDLVTDGVNYELARNAVTQRDVLRVLRQAGTPAFDDLLNAARTGLTRWADKGWNDPPPFTTVPRNAAVRLVFSRAIDFSTVTAQTIQVLAGEARTPVPLTMIGSNDLVGPDGHPRGTVILAAANSGNPSGFPASELLAERSLIVRIPTVVEPANGQFSVLRSQLGDKIQARPGKPVETSPGGNPIVVRAAESGPFQWVPKRKKYSARHRRTCLHTYLLCATPSAMAEVTSGAFRVIPLT